MKLINNRWNNAWIKFNMSDHAVIHHTQQSSYVISVVRLYTELMNQTTPLAMAC